MRKLVFSILLVLLSSCGEREIDIGDGYKYVQLDGQTWTIADREHRIVVDPDVTKYKIVGRFIVGERGDINIDERLSKKYGLFIFDKQNKTLINLDKAGVAIQGYDPVAFFTDSKPVKGKPEFPARHNGALYYFASKEHRELFKGDPAKYEPVFGGYCAYGVSHGSRAPVKIEAWQIVNGRLLMQYDLGVKDEFNKDQQGTLKKADQNWPGLVDKYGK